MIITDDLSGAFLTLSLHPFSDLDSNVRRRWRGAIFLPNPSLDKKQKLDKIQFDIYRNKFMDVKYERPSKPS
jgi:hypothetical protein